MKNQKNSFSKFVDCEHKELFFLSGMERYEAINNLTIEDTESMCSFYGHCNKCPLFLNGKENRSYCADLASDTLVKDALEHGAQFNALED